MLNQKEGEGDPKEAQNQTQLRPIDLAKAAA